MFIPRRLEKEIRKGDTDFDHIQDIEENFHLNYNKKCSV